MNPSTFAVEGAFGIPAHRRLRAARAVPLILCALLAAGCNVGARPSAVWSPDGKQISLDPGGRLYAFDTDTSTFRKLSSGPRRAFNPVWSPDGQRIAYLTAPAAPSRGGDLVLDVVEATRGKRILSRTLAKGSVEDDEDEPSLFILRGFYVPAWCAGGRQIRCAVAGDEGSIVSAEIGTPGVRTEIRPWANMSAAWSPDARRVVYYRESGEGDSHEELCVLEVGAPAGRTLWTLPPRRHQALLSSVPQWAPDGGSVGVFVCAEVTTGTIDYVSVEDGPIQAWLVPLDGGVPEPLLDLSPGDGLAAFSPDLKSVVFLRKLPGNKLAVMRLDAPYQEPRALFELDASPLAPKEGEDEDEDEERRRRMDAIGLPSFSPDGQMLALVVTMPGRAPRLYLAAFDGSPPRVFAVPER